MINTPTDAEIWQMWIPMTRMGVADPVEFARAVLAKWSTPPVAGEPVAWQSRMRPTWGNNTAPWTQWEPCTKGQAEDYWKTNLLHDWAFEARALYTTPQPTQAADSVLEDAERESEYRRGYRHGYEQREAEVRGALV